MDRVLNNIENGDSEEARIENELNALEAKIAELAESFETLTELDGEVLNRLIHSIVIGDRIKENGITEQQIRINYRFIGEIA